MIKANELRVGNILWYQTLNVVPVNFMNKGMVKIEDVDPEYFPDDPMINRFMGVELTPEILEKCGFKFIPDWDYPDRSKGDAWILKPYIVSETGNNIYGISWIIGGIFSSSPTELRFLHQLQNLYFSITGEELNVEL